MRIAPIIARLKAQTSVFKNISVARSLNTVDASDLADLPVAFVYPLEDLPSESKTLSMISQDIGGDFGVLIGARHATSTSDPLEDAREEVFSALVGYEIDNYPVTFKEGRVFDVTADVLLWRDIFTYHRLLRNPLS